MNAAAITTEAVPLTVSNGFLCLLGVELGRHCLELRLGVMERYFTSCRVVGHAEGAGRAQARRQPVNTSTGPSSDRVRHIAVRGEPPAGTRWARRGATPLRHWVQAGHGTARTRRRSLYRFVATVNRGASACTA